MSATNWGYYYHHYMHLPSPDHLTPAISSAVVVPGAPVYQCQRDTAPPPPLTVLQTNSLPLTPAKSTNLQSEKNMGKSLSRYTKK